MLKCNQIAHMASDYVDNNLNWKDALSLKIHIAMCRHCHRFVRHLRLTIEYAKNIKKDLAPAEKVEHVMNKLFKK